MYYLFLVVIYYDLIASKPVIHFGAFISNVLKDELCFKAAIDTAVELINEDDTILKDFDIKMEYFDNYVRVFLYTNAREY